jgi:hypothetical protein
VKKHFTRKNRVALKQLTIILGTQFFIFLALMVNQVQNYSTPAMAQPNPPSQVNLGRAEDRLGSITKSV